jgi:hypothetical protein
MRLVKNRTNNVRTLKPQCLYARDGHDQQVCLNAAGYFTPCCWFDAEDALEEDERIAGFFNPDLNIKNHEDPKDIIEGEYWQVFFRELVEKPNKAPARCWRMCGSELITDQRIASDTRIAV